MKNFLIFFLAFSTTSSVAYAGDAELEQPYACAQKARKADDRRVQVILSSYAQVVHFYQSEIDADTVQFLAVKTAELEAHFNAQLNASEEEALHLMTQHFTLHFAH